MNDKVAVQAKPKNKLYIGVVQDSDGKITKILTGNDYEQVWFQVSVESKSVRGFFEIRDLGGRFVDGNYRPRVVK